MSNLKSIVPPLELCKQIPEGEFEDSALVWVYDMDGLEMVMPREVVQFEGTKMIAAPTLEEILDDLFFTAVFCKCGIWIIDRFYEYPTKSEEALRLWLTVKGIEVE